MTAQPHTIRRMRLRVHVQQPEQAFTLQQQMSVCLQDILPARLAAMLDKHVSGEEYVYLPALNIQISGLPAEGWEHLFTQQVLHQVEATLLQQLENLRPETDNNETAATPGEWDQPVRLSATSKYQQAWIFFMEHGILPWWAQPEQGETAFTRKVVTAIRTAPARFRHYWLEAWQREAIPLLRWLQQCPHDMQAAILEAITGAETGAIILRWESALTERLSPPTSPGRILQLRLLYWHAFFSLAVHQPSITGPAGWAALLAQAIKAQWSVQTGAELQQQEAYIIDSTLPPGNGIPAQPPIDALSVTAPPQRHEAGVNGMKQEGKTAPVPAAHLLVRNAGLVLLHPFLLLLFEGLQWLDHKKEKIQARYMEKAVHLIAFMANGEEQTPEYDMLLNKILCGLQPEACIAQNITLTAAEKDEGEALLQAVLQHWKPLQGSSIAALQTAFLQRQGKLSFNKDHWLLQVERQTMDILLEQLPWGTGMIKLPWMQYLLRTEWII